MTADHQTSDPIPCRAHITSRLAELHRIHTPEGIEALETVEIGGSHQWVSIRGKNKANPALLFIHGGPSSPVMPLSWAFQAPWEDFFTVVQWDQRGAGKNAAEFDLDKMADTLTLEQFFQDTLEMIEYVCDRLEKEKIFVLGWSWGTALGLYAARNIHQRLYAFISTGQVSADSESRAYQRVLALARQAGHAEAVAELESIFPHPHPEGDTPKRNIMIARKWMRFYNGGWYGKRDLGLYFSLHEWSPEYTQADAENFINDMSKINEKMIPILNQVRVEEIGLEFEIPIILLMGRYDLHTSYVAAREFYDRVRAPHKKFITFERSGHFPMFEEPGRFLMALVNDVLPLAGERITFERGADAPE